MRANLPEQMVMARDAPISILGADHQDHDLVGQADQCTSDQLNVM